MIISYLLGKRTGENAKVLLRDMRKRVTNTPQITTDGYSAYVDAVKEAFGADVHYATQRLRLGMSVRCRLESAHVPREFDQVVRQELIRFLDIPTEVLAHGLDIGIKPL